MLHHGVGRLRRVRTPGAGGGPLVLYDFTTGTLDPSITFTRASTGTRFNSAGLLVSEAIDAPRFDYNPATLAIRGLLIEPARTNALTYSEQLDNAAWSKVRCGITANAAVAPDGTTTADKIVPTAGQASPYVFESKAMTNGVPVAFSAFGKPAEYNSLAIRLDDNVPASFSVFNLATGLVASTGANQTCSMEQAADGWWRCISRYTPDSTTTGSVGVGSAHNGLFTQVGDGASGIYVAGVQLEDGAYASSYIPAVASAVARSADEVKFTPPAGVSAIRFTFDDDSTQDVSVTPEVEYTIPTTLNRRHIKSISSI